MGFVGKLSEFSTQLIYIGRETGIYNMRIPSSYTTVRLNFENFIADMDGRMAACDRDV